MKKHLIRENIPLHSDEWHAHRLNYINASELGAVLGLSKYSCAAKIFNEKIGVLPPWKEGNRFTHFGLRIEDIIAEAWEHYEPQGEEDNYVKNCKDGNLIRKCKNIGGYIRNPKYEWLSMSLDRVINKGMPRMTGEILKEEVPLELKSIQSYALNQWETVPPSYLAQITLQMIIMEVDYSELCLLDSSQKLHLYPIEYNDEFAQQILEITHDLWYKRVLPAKELLKSLESEVDDSKKGDIQYEIDQLEPDSTDSPAYEDFLKEKHKDGYVKDAKEGNMDDWANGVHYNQWSAEVKKAEETKQVYRNKILKSLGKHEYLSFGEDGEISYSPDKSGKRSLRVKLKN